MPPISFRSASTGETYVWYRSPSRAGSVAIPVCCARPEVSPPDREAPRGVRNGDAGHRAEPLHHLVRRDRRAVAEAREGARRGLGALGDPAIQVHQRRPRQRRVVHRVEAVDAGGAVLGVDVLERQAARAVLGAGEEVAADLGRRLDVARAGEVGVDQRGVAAPVLGRGVDRVDLRHAAELALPIQQPADSPVCRVGLGVVGERHQVPEAGRRLIRRLGEAVVELAAPPARHLGQQPVEHLTPVLVQVQTEVEEVAQESPALRDAVAVALDRFGRRTGSRPPRRRGAGTP